MNKDNFKIVVALTSIVQAGISVFVPVILLYIAAKFLINTFNWPEKTIVFSIILGVLCGFYNMIKYIYLMINRRGE